MREDGFDKMIKSALHENEDDIDIFDNLLIVPKEEMMSRIKKRGINRYEIKAIKTAILVIIILSISIASSIISENDKVNALFFSFKKVFLDIKDEFISIIYTDRQEKIKEETKVYNSSHILEVQKNTSINIYVPQSIPIGYNFKEIKHEKLFNDKEIIIQTYENMMKKSFFIIQKKGLADMDLVVDVPKNCEVKEITVMGQLGHMIMYENGYKTVLWFKDGIQYEVSGNFTEEELLEMLGTN